MNFFDTADVYSDGASESILGAAIRGRRDEVAISTKVTLRLGTEVNALDEVVHATGKTIPQIALNWGLQRPTVATVLIGARDEAQLRENLGAVGWQLSAEQMGKLDAVSALKPPILTILIGAGLLRNERRRQCGFR